ncbi:Paraneoplastic antigen Ma1 [Holothuria leucospilota]|uniref:Paraneoplastic antigen Ma1 n=1 Tax=Holothuria leucospilota TaxID=206669 RepID=A0A9Q0YE81_HOLLE|nr:Paraneoplastic antigen Ma1 [Holothuria leucospilota]
MEEDWCRLSDPERKRRIREVLRTPASDVIFDLRQDKPPATSLDYLTALETAFGSAESGEELYFQLHSLQQREGKKTSQFLVRLQDKIQKVIQKGRLQL